MVEAYRIYVPQAMRGCMLDWLHRSHLGMELTMQAARSMYMWPGMRECIARKVANCPACFEMSDCKQKEQWKIDENPALAPMDRVGLDLFFFENKWSLILVDYFSRYCWMKQYTKTPSSAELIKSVRHIFNDYGWPKYLRTDGGPQMRSEAFTKFCKDTSITLELASAYHHESNGLAERTVRTIKNLFKKTRILNEEFLEGLAALRSNPTSNMDVSPARIMMGRQLRNPNLPSLPDGIDVEAAAAAGMARRRDEKLHHNEKVKKCGSAIDLKVGQIVRLQDPHTKRWDQEGRVQALRPHGRSAYILADSGRVYLRNRRFIRILECEENMLVVCEPRSASGIPGCMVRSQQTGVSSGDSAQRAAREARPAVREKSVRFKQNRHIWGGGLRKRKKNDLTTLSGF